MRVKFYPRDIEFWRSTEEYDFSKRLNKISTLECPQKEDYKVFDSRVELIEYLKERGVRMDDPDNPLIFTQENHHVFGKNTYTVIQWSLLGWCVDCY